MSGGMEALWYPEQPEGLFRRLLAGPLTLASGVYALGAAGHRALYRWGLLPTVRLSGVRVVSVGNLVVGGAGKTPTVMHLVSWALSRGIRVGVLSRGYGRRAARDVLFQAPMSRAGNGGLPSWQETGDEPLLIAQRCPGVWLGVGADRARLGRRLRDEAGVELLLLDDGFQHRRLARDVDVVVLDGASPVGNGRLLPRGPLRESLRAGLERASVIWWRETERQLGGPARADWTNVLGQFPCIRVRHRSASLLRAGRVEPPGVLRGVRVLALAGLARPRGFLLALEGLGAVRVGERLFPDHHAFSDAELAQVEEEARRKEAWVVTTEKDAVRLPEGYPVCVLRQEVELVEGEGILERFMLGTPA